MKMKFKKIEDGVPSINRDVQVLLYDKTMSVGFFNRNRDFIPSNVEAIVDSDVFFDNSVIAWAELPEVDYE